MTTKNVIRLAVASSLLVAGSAMAAFTEFDTVRGWHSWQRDIPSSYSGTSGSIGNLVTHTTKSLAIPKATAPITIDVTARVVNSASILAKVAKLSTPVGVALTLFEIAELLESQGMSDPIRSSTGWTAMKPKPGTGCDATQAISFCGSKPDSIDLTNRCLSNTYTVHYGNTTPPSETCYSYGVETGDAASERKEVSDEEFEQGLKNALARESSPGGSPSPLSPQITSLIDSALNNPDFRPKPILAPTQITGPSTTPGPVTNKVSSPDADGKVTTTTTTPTINITYEGDDIRTTTTTTITTTVVNPDGSAQSTRTETETAQDPLTDPGKDTKEGILCSLFPDILACKKLEDPGTEEIPKETRNIELQTGPDFSGGSCIPNVVVSVFGNQITVLDMAEPCRWIETMLKPLILLFAAMSAVFIVMPRSD